MPKLEDVIGAFEGSGLGGREIISVAVADTGEVGFELDIDGSDPLSAWQLARPVCDELGLWPFVPDYEGQNVYSRHFYDEVRDGRDQRPTAIVARAEALPWPLEDPKLDATVWFARDWLSVIRLCRESTVRRLGDAPSEDELLASCPYADYFALERVVLEWEEARRPTMSQEPPGRFDEPLLDLGRKLVLLPTPRAWAVPAYFHFWGAGSRRNEALVRTLRSWHDRHGAVVWAATGVTLHLHVARPISDIYEAFAVAAEQLPFCKPDDELRERARALFGATFWELYDRP